MKVKSELLSLTGKLKWKGHNCDKIESIHIDSIHTESIEFECDNLLIWFVET